MHMAATTKQWTMEELHRLPDDDGNKYELVRGELFVTPPPNEAHETIAARLTRILDPYAEEHGLGFVFHPRAVMRFDGSEVEPDLMVRQPLAPGAVDWDGAPTPMLIVEILSGSTRRRDQLQKRNLYIDAGVADYWLVDPDRRMITVARPGQSDLRVSDELSWSPAGAARPLVVELSRVFG
jgi:Uma2 family endonuclease